jgi:hypothetical protein
MIMRLETPYLKYYPVLTSFTPAYNETVRVVAKQRGSRSFLAAR